jgi:hypothetical protein
MPAILCHIYLPWSTEMILFSVVHIEISMVVQPKVATASTHELLSLALLLTLSPTNVNGPLGFAS